MTDTDFPLLKKKYLKEAQEEANSTHPENSPSMLRCIISSEFMKNPVITPRGYVYEKECLEKWLAINSTDPRDRAPLCKEDFEPFPELKDIIKAFEAQQTNYIYVKEKLIQDARAVANQDEETLSEKPALFLCPLSKNIMDDPVITATGKIYDRGSLKKHGYRDENEKQLSENDFVSFNEFKSQIKLYNFYFQFSKKKLATVSKGQSTYFGSFFHSLYSTVTLLFGDQEAAKEPSLDQKNNSIK